MTKLKTFNLCFRYGWFIPKNLSKSEYEDWRTFMQPEKTRMFSLTENDRIYVKKHTFLPIGNLNKV